MSKEMKKVRLVSLRFSRRPLVYTLRGQTVTPEKVTTPNAARLTVSAHAYEILRETLRDLPMEQLWGIALSSKNDVLACYMISSGTLMNSLVRPAEVFAPAMLLGAAGLIVAHNHPSGDPEPSEEDIQVTERLVSSGALLGIALLDHVVIGSNGYVSLSERGHLVSRSALSATEVREGAERKPVIEVPALDIDARMEKEFGRKLTPNCVLERRIVAHLCAHLAAAGWKPSMVNDGESLEQVDSVKALMELVFNLDDCWGTARTSCPTGRTAPRAPRGSGISTGSTRR